jgi:hypothetical protein
MNDNPTALRVGASGVLSGIRYRVIGRVTMGMTEDGETYYWQEFNLLDDTGRNATLVYEEGEWKLFVMFEPERPMSAAKAAGKRVGDVVNLDGRPVEITLVGESTVYSIEGRAPEGVERGDVAQYFNADTGVEMLVVSWTGDEVECFRGVDVPAEEVTKAFGTQTFSSGPAFRATEEEPSSSSSGTMSKIMVGVVVAVIALAGQTWWKKSQQPAGTKKSATLVVSLPAGRTGSVGGKLCTLTGQTKVEIWRVGSKYDWMEYALDDGSLLVGGMNVGANEWFLFHAEPMDLTPQQAATLRAGSQVTIAGKTLRVEDLFQYRTPTQAGFGVLARNGNDRAIVRWTENAVEVYLGAPVAEKEVLAAFKE